MYGTMNIKNIEVTFPAETNFKSPGGNSKTLKYTTFKVLKEKSMLQI
jgi:hypothetical protein